MKTIGRLGSACFGHLSFCQWPIGLLATILFGPVCLSDTQARTTRDEPPGIEQYLLLLLDRRRQVYVVPDLIQPRRSRAQSRRSLHASFEAFVGASGFLAFNTPWVYVNTASSIHTRHTHAHAPPKRTHFRCFRMRRIG